MLLVTYQRTNIEYVLKIAFDSTDIWLAFLLTIVARIIQIFVIVKVICMYFFKISEKHSFAYKDIKNSKNYENNKYYNCFNVLLYTDGTLEFYHL